MSNCNCCNPNCAPPCPGESAPDGYDTTYTGSNVLVADDNGAPRGLKGDGILVRQDGSAFHTNGSARDGEIKLTPEAIGGGDQLPVLAAGVLKALIAAENEGKVLIVQGGKFTLVNPTEARTTFNPADLGQYTDALAAIGCGPGGTVRLGKHKPTPSTFVYYDETGKLVALPQVDMAKLLISLLCANMEVLGAAESIQHAFGCTIAGETRKFLPVAQGTFYIRPRHIIAFQSNPSTPFTPIDVNFDYRTIAGYDPKWTTALISIDLAAYSGTRSYDLYVVIDGEEYARVHIGGGSESDSVNNQIMIPIPVGKISNFKVLEYTDAVGTYGPNGVGIRLDAFML